MEKSSVKTYNVIISDRKFFHKKDELIMECKPDDLKDGESFYITEHNGSYCYLFEDTGRPEWHRATGKTYTNDNGVKFITMTNVKLIKGQLIHLTKSNYEKIFNTFKDKTVTIRSALFDNGVKCIKSYEAVITKVACAEDGVVNVYHHHIDNDKRANLIFCGSTSLDIDDNNASIVSITAISNEDKDRPLFEKIHTCSITVKRNML